MNLLSRLTKPKVDPDTPVQVWEVDVVLIPPSHGISNKTRLPDITWKEAQKRYKIDSNSLKNGSFDKNNPIILLLGTVNSPSVTILALTATEFSEKLSAITTRNSADTIKWREEELKPLHAAIGIFAAKYGDLLRATVEWNK